MSLLPELPGSDFELGKLNWEKNNVVLCSSSPSPSPFSPFLFFPSSPFLPSSSSLIPSEHEASSLWISNFSQNGVIYKIEQWAVSDSSINLLNLWVLFLPISKMVQTQNSIILLISEEIHHYSPKLHKHMFYHSTPLQLKLQGKWKGFNFLFFYRHWLICQVRKWKDNPWGLIGTMWKDHPSLPVWIFGECEGWGGISFGVAQK